jgi:hypothetical protein
MKNRTKLGALLAAGVLSFAAFGVAFATVASDQGVTPTLHDGNISEAGNGNTDGAACDGADALGFNGAGADTTDNGVTVTVTYDTTTHAVGFTATGGLVTIAYIKGSNAYNEYDYAGAGVASDGNLFAPDAGQSGQPAALSHAVFCTGPAAEGSPSGSGAGDTDAPSGTPVGTGNGDTDSPTQPPTNGLASNGSGPSDGAWLLVVGLGVLLASVVVLTPARVKNRR